MFAIIQSSESRISSIINHQFSRQHQRQSTPDLHTPKKIMTLKISIVRDPELANSSLPGMKTSMKNVSFTVQKFINEILSAHRLKGPATRASFTERFLALDRICAADNQASLDVRARRLQFFLSSTGGGGCRRKTT